MIPTSVLVKLATLGLSAEQAEAVVRMLYEVEAANSVTPDSIEKQRSASRDRTLLEWRGAR